MSCRDAVYSNDYYNFIIRNSAYLAGYEPGECHIDLDSLYTIEFAKREGLPPLGRLFLLRTDARSVAEAGDEARVSGGTSRRRRPVLRAS